MIFVAFDYVWFIFVAEVIEVLGSGGEDVKVFAGGQLLILVLRLWMFYLSTFVDLGWVEELWGVRDDGDAILIGSMTTHFDVMHDPLVAEHAPIIAQATVIVADC